MDLITRVKGLLIGNKSYLSNFLSSELDHVGITLQIPSVLICQTLVTNP
ncbi:hypothetical protein GXM_10489 [Nostoc sphaeroides CCNUC1]|uniref:Uncharacterized protein n=1 Tax=Nostoc sphaeroides CCNUC1 TaxID=2653204 RepID=A0A5P8WJ35_9NOSO|nr:hypothetical protein GXM_10489 [Nostoc sphaeroides CCNUC1]